MRASDMSFVCAENARALSTTAAALRATSEIPVPANDRREQKNRDAEQHDVQGAGGTFCQQTQLDEPGDQRRIKRRVVGQWFDCAVLKSSQRIVRCQSACGIGRSQSGAHDEAVRSRVDNEEDSSSAQNEGRAVR
jgi:hypothetical protein